ncbi:MAG: RlmE family RNA methyltransferase [Bacteroidetes bacterium]|nr:RlmE family RNA methyltransferase [Bacteroidota bacterium]
MSYKPNDYYAQKAQKENFAARSIYKLEEIDQRFKILASGDSVLDLGASPGSWSQYASKKAGPKGKILGVDLKAVTVHLPNAVFIQCDINDLNLEDLLTKYDFKGKFDAVISDMAPNTTGNKLVDQSRSYDLCMMALETAKKFLKPNGNFVCKIFESSDAMIFRDEMKQLFGEVKILRPKGTQSSSKEMFMIGLKFITESELLT